MLLCLVESLRCLIAVRRDRVSAFQSLEAEAGFFCYVLFPHRRAAPQATFLQLGLRCSRAVLGKARDLAHSGLLVQGEGHFIGAFIVPVDHLLILLPGSHVAIRVWRRHWCFLFSVEYLGNMRHFFLLQKLAFLSLIALTSAPILDL